MSKPASKAFLKALRKSDAKAKPAPDPVAKKLRVWWVAQVPCKAFRIPVSSVDEAKKLLTVLSDYDRFQFENRIKPDYCNAGGLEELDSESGWCEWTDEDGNDIDDLIRQDGAR